MNPRPILVLLAFSIWTLTASGQEDAAEADHPDSIHPEKLAQLQAEVSRLKAALKSGHQEASANEQDHSAHSSTQSIPAQDDDDAAPKMPMSQGMKMGGMSKMKGMKMGGKDGMMKHKMEGGMKEMMKDMMGEGMREMMREMMGKGMDGMMKDMMGKDSDESKMKDGMTMKGMKDGMMMKGMMRKRMMGKTPDEALSRSGLPGFPGVSHIYHIGASDFFLDHSEHLTLTPDQLTEINKTKEKSLLEQSSYDRKIDQAEQDLWSLTAQDAPDVEKIGLKLQAIGELQSSQRIAFIRSVGEAAKSLSDHQRRSLMGQEASPSPTEGGTTADSSHNH